MQYSLLILKVQDFLRKLFGVFLENLISNVFRGMWVMTEMNLKNGIPGAFKEASDLLKEYMDGDNMENVKIESTKPATVIFVMRDQVCFSWLLNF